MHLEGSNLPERWGGGGGGAYYRMYCFVYRQTGL